MTTAAAVMLALLLVTSVAEAREWAWLGVRIRDLAEQEMEDLSARHGIREGFGVMIVEVLDNTAAARGGLRSGDVVVAFAERPVTDTRTFQRLIGAAPIDRDTRLTVLRADGRHQLAVRLTTMPRDVAGERVAAEFGFGLRPVAPPSSSGPDAPANDTPVVAVVTRGGPAERAGLQVGDVILAVAERAVVSVDIAREALAGAPLDRPLELSVRRESRYLTLTLSPAS